jgi:hypothetical protein
MRSWFAKPKPAPYGISKSFYLSVLSSKSQLPLILEVVNPQASAGAVEGFGAPLARDATKEALGRPMERGAYVLATKDRKTLLKLIVVSTDEAFFDTNAIVENAQALGLDDELVNRIRATWMVLQLTFEAYDPAVAPAVTFLRRVSTRLAALTEGVIADPICRRYSLPVPVLENESRIEAADHLAAQCASGVCFTLGLQKFNLPELILTDVPTTHEPMARELLLATAQHCLNGQLIQAGDMVGEPPKALVAQPGPNTGQWEGVETLLLLPQTGDVSESLAAWQASAG